MRSPAVIFAITIYLMANSSFHTVDAFFLSPRSFGVVANQHTIPVSSPTRLFLASDSDEQKQKLEQLGFSPGEINKSRSIDKPEEPKVAVTEMNIDPLTLTAVGFGLIAMNFLVFANMGDGGLGGIVARIINASS